MKVDVRVGGNRAQFASQLAHIPPDALAKVEGCFIGDESPDFYEGLLAGFAAIYQMLVNMPPDVVTQFTGEFIAYIAGNKHKQR